MKILFVSEYWNPVAQGGGEISMEILAESLAKKGLDISILTSHFPKTKKFEIKNKVKIYRKLKTGKDPKSLLSNLKRTLIFPKSAKKEIKKLQKNFDIIHYLNTTSTLAIIKHKKSYCHVNSPVFFCPKGTLMYQDKRECRYKCTKKRFKKCFLKSREIGKAQLKWYYKHNPLLRHLIYNNFRKRLRKLKQANYYTPISNFLKQKLIENNIKENKIQVLPNIIEIEKFQKKSKNNPQKILFISAYLENKGAMILLKALKEIKEIKEKYQCNFYGEGSSKNKMINYTKKHNLNVKINNKVPYNKIPEIVSNHDILIFPSLVLEAFGRVVIEAQAARLKVIASSIGGTKELLDKKYQVQPGNVKELKQAIENALKTTNKKDILKAQKNANKYKADKITENIIKFYKK